MALLCFFYCEYSVGPTNANTFMIVYESLPAHEDKLEFVYIGIVCSCTIIITCILWDANLND